jgi:glucose/arabinose dehydrogenase
MKLVPILFALFTFTTACGGPRNGDSTKKADASSLTLPAGFRSSVFADNLGKARHMAVAPNGDVYVKLERVKEGKGILQLVDADKDGVAETVSGFAGFGGTGIAIRNGYLYASSNDDVYRYRMDNGQVKDKENPERIVTGLVNKGQHASKSITLDNNGFIYVNIGAPSNICQVEDRKMGSPGQTPCPILEKAGGIWQFRADGKEQGYAEGVRYATGLRNVVGLDWNSEVNDLFAMQHGRDMLFQHYPQLFNQQEGAENPAEEMFRLPKGADAGWPYCYYDNGKKQKLLNPEYGGDRSKTGDCTSKTPSVYQFPGHLAPNAMLFYTGNQFPEKYRNGAFIAFHGSWNRSPEPQEGFYVVFVPMKNGMPSGKWEVFADGFAGAGKAQGRADYRPCGLAMGPDGSLYVSDDNKGRVWKISYPKSL